jgi:hypothetical protein
MIVQVGLLANIIISWSTHENEVDTPIVMESHILSHQPRSYFSDTKIVKTDSKAPMGMPAAHAWFSYEGQPWG